MANSWLLRSQGWPWPSLACRGPTTSCDPEASLFSSARSAPSPASSSPCPTHPCQRQALRCLLSAVRCVWWNVARRSITRRLDMPQGLSARLRPFGSVSCLLVIDPNALVPAASCVLLHRLLAARHAVHGGAGPVDELPARHCLVLRSRPP